MGSLGCGSEACFSSLEVGMGEVVGSLDCGEPPRRGMGDGVGCDGEDVVVDISRGGAKGTRDWRRDGGMRMIER